MAYFYPPSPPFYWIDLFVCFFLNLLIITFLGLIVYWFIIKQKIFCLFLPVCRQ